MNIKETLLIFVRGLLMGMADIIPGVSGGTIALITGIYERLIFAIKGLNVSFIKYILRKDWTNTRKHLFSMDLGFLIPLGLGIFVAFMTLSRVIRFLMATYPADTYAFFFGLILASTVIVYKQLGGINVKVVVSAIIGFSFAFILLGLGTLQSIHTLPIVFVSGFVAVCAMIIPGVSGAFILFFLGQYEYLLSILHGFDFMVIATFMTGAVIGLLSMARVLSYLLKNYKSITMAFLVGLMLGALRMPYENVLSVSYYLPTVIMSGIIGVVVVVLLEKVGDKFRVDD